jgi:spore germination protein YaaH
MKRLETSLLVSVLAFVSMLTLVPPVGAAAVQVPRTQAHPRIMSAAADIAAQPATAPLSAASAEAPLPLNLQAAANSGLHREVFGFVNAGNLGNSSVGYPSWNFSLLSTVAYFGLQVNSGDGNLVQNTIGWYVYQSPTMRSFINAAHASGVKVILSLNLHDFSTSPGNQVCQGLAPANAQNTINQAVAQVNAAQVEGINVDYEGTNTTCTNGLTSRSEMTDFVKNLRAALPSGKYVAIDTYTGSAEDNLEFFDVTGLAPYVDSFFVMAYDMDFENAQNPPLSCSSYCFNPVSALNTYRFNVTKSMAQYTALVPASKVILGQPYYGRKACVANPYAAHQLLDNHQYPSSPPNFVSPQYLDAIATPSDSATSSFQAHRDPGDWAAEWDTWWSSDFGCWREQNWDDTQSLGAKYDVVNQDNLRGVGLFTLDYGGGSPELWALLARKFTTTTSWASLGGIVTSGPDASSWSANRTDVFVRGTDNGMWQKTWNGSSWSGWSPLGGILTADPGVASWGPNRIDVFVRGTDNAMWHKWGDGTTFYGWEAQGGYLTSGPDVASWAAGRLDVFVRGADNALWHKFWAGGWSGWESLGGVLTSDPTAVSWGPNRIDVFVRGTDNGLWRKAWDGGRWTGWEQLGGALTSAPDVASCSAGHLDVFATGAGSVPMQLGFNGAWNGGWGAWQSLGGQLTSEPSAVCQTGTSSIQVFGRGVDNTLWWATVPAS